MYRLFVAASILALFYGSASTVGAQTSTVRPPIDASKCPKGSSTEMTTAKRILFTAETKQADAERFLSSNIHCPNACYNLSATLTLLNTGLQVDIRPTHVCTSREKAPNDPVQSPKRGCGANEQQPRITIQTRDVFSNVLQFDIKDETITKSRCNSDSIDTSIKKFFAGLSKVTSDPGSGQREMQAALDGLRATPEYVPPVGAANGSDQLLASFRAANIPEDQAKAAIDKDAVTAVNYIQAINAGNAEDVRKYGTILGLNPDLSAIDQRAVLAASKPVDQWTDRETPPNQWNTASAQTFPQNPYSQASPLGELHIAPTGSPSAPLLAGNKINPSVLGSIAADAQRRVCAAISGLCYVTPQAQFATMMNETNGNVRLYGDGGRSTSLAQVYQPTALGLLNKYQSVYGEEYVLHRTDIRSETLNPEWIASQSLRMQALVIQDKATQTGGNFQRTVSAYNGGGYAAAAYGVRAVRNAYALQSGNAASYWQEAYNSTLAAGATGPAITNLAPSHQLPGYSPQYSSSPFAQVNPFGNSQVDGRVVCTATGYCYLAGYAQPAPIAQPVQVAQPVPVAPAAQQTLPTPQIRPSIPTPGTGTSPAVATSTAVASLVAQPKEAKRGTPVAVSWSSIGMSTEMPCQLFVGTSFLAQGNEGTRTFETKAVTASTSVKFTLQCFSKAGAKIQQETAVLVK
jgi:hypothetical protein